jgi:hypothetical protein
MVSASQHNVGRQPFTTPGVPELNIQPGSDHLTGSAVRRVIRPADGPLNRPGHSFAATFTEQLLMISNQQRQQGTDRLSGIRIHDHRLVTIRRPDQWERTVVRVPSLYLLQLEDGIDQATRQADFGSPGSTGRRSDQQQRSERDGFLDNQKPLIFSRMQ